MSGSRLRQDSMIMRSSHFKNLKPSLLAEQLHQTLAAELGPILATAALRRAADHCEVKIGEIQKTHLDKLLPVLMESLRSYTTAPTLQAALQALK